MARQQLSVRERVEACQYLEAVATGLNRMAAALAERGLETEADMAQAAAHSCLACCWWISRPLRALPPPEAWKTAGMGPYISPQQRADQQQQR